MFGVFRSANATLSDGQQSFPALDSTGAMRVNDGGTAANTVSPSTALTGQRITFNATADQTIVAATAAQTTKAHRLRLSIAGATNISIKDGATVLEVFQFAGAGALILDFSERPYYVTTANTAFVIASSALVAVEGRIDFVKS